MILGYAGYMNFGSIVFFGLGGYVCVWLMSAPAGPCAAQRRPAGVDRERARLVFGLGILRLRGAYFALATIGVNEAVMAFVANFEPWGGSRGIYLSTELFQPLGGAEPGAVDDLLPDGGRDGAVALPELCGSRRSKFGLGLRAIGQNEDAAVVLGRGGAALQGGRYSLSAFLPAVAGGLYFFKSAFIQPPDAFDLPALDRGDRDRDAGRARGPSPGRRSGLSLRTTAWLAADLASVLEFPAGYRGRPAARHRSLRAWRADGLALSPLAGLRRILE